jgi:hypothetical protein
MDRSCSNVENQHVADLDLAAPELAAIERYRPDLLVMEYYQGQRPLTGLIEQVDWRICGLLSRWIARRRITGAKGEVVLAPPGRHIRCGYLLVVGMGDRCSSLDSNRAVERILRAGEQLMVRSIAMPLPGRAPGFVDGTLAARFVSNRVRGLNLHLIVIEEEPIQAEVARALLVEVD